MELRKDNIPLQRIPEARPNANAPKTADDDSATYDVPKPTTVNNANVNMNVGPSSNINASDRSSGLSVMSCDSTSSSASSLPASESPYLSSNRSSLDTQEVYDYPPEPRKVVSNSKPQLPNKNSLRNLNSNESVYDIPPQVSRDCIYEDVTKLQNVIHSLNLGTSQGGRNVPCLYLEFDSAMESLHKLQQDVQNGLDKLVNFNATTILNKNTSFEQRYHDCNNIINKLIASIKEFITFSVKSRGNLIISGKTPQLVNQISKPIESLTTTFGIINTTWENATKNKDDIVGTSTQIANISKPLNECIRDLVKMLKTNATFIYKRTPTQEMLNKQPVDDSDKTPIQDRLVTDIDNIYANAKAFLEDYDYAKLDSKDNVDNTNNHNKEGLPSNMRQSYDNLMEPSFVGVDSDHNKIFANANMNEVNNQKNGGANAIDRQIVEFYGSQADQHFFSLNAAIDAFFSIVEANQPPKVTF